MVDSRADLQCHLSIVRWVEGGMWHDEIMFKRLSVDGGNVGQAAADALYHSNGDMQPPYVPSDASFINPFIWHVDPFKSKRWCQMLKNFMKQVNR